MTQSDERKKLFAEARAELQARHLANSDAFDKAVLALSTVFLGLSLGFVKDFIPLHLAQWQWILVFSWAALAGSVILTVISFFVGQVAALTQLDHARQYYLEEKDEFLHKANRAAKAAECIDRLSGAFFVLAIIATVAFAVVNLEGANMASKNKFTQDLTVKPTQDPLVKAAKPLPLTPASTQVPTGTGPASKPAGGAGNQGTSSSGSPAGNQGGGSPPAKAKQ